MKAKCLKVVYKAGSYELCQGVKDYQDGKSVGGKWFSNRGYGWGEHIESSKLILHTEVRGKKEQIWVDRFFKDKLGRLIERRRVLIQKTMPEFVSVRRAVGSGGTKYWTVTEKDLGLWLSRIEALPENTVSAVKKKISARKKVKWQEAKKEQARLERRMAGVERQMRFEEQRRLEERRRNALRLAFTIGHNPKYGDEQWEARQNGRLFVLRREDVYEPSEGEIPVEERFDLVPGRIVLVQRI